MSSAHVLIVIKLPVYIWEYLRFLDHAPQLRLQSLLNSQSVFGGNVVFRSCSTAQVLIAIKLPSIFGSNSGSNCYETPSLYLGESVVFGT